MRLTEVAVRGSPPGSPAAWAPIDAEAFADLMAPFAPFESRPTVAVGVSGGRDSLALALLAHDWAGARGGAVHGLIVDHGLRAEAAEEAETTHRALARHGIGAEVLHWQGDKPSHGLQAAARTARHRLLLAACARRGILHLLLAHHADDQAETVTMRADRNSGLDGLAGMAAVVERREARLLRPLLAVPRARLTATLLARGVAWIDDPSNDDPRFERVRLRREGRAAPLAGQGGTERAARERALAEAAVQIVEADGPAGIAFDQAGFGLLTPELAAALLSRAVQVLGGSDHPPRRDRLERACRRLQAAGDRGKSGKSQDFTLSGCHLMLRRAPDGRHRRWIVRPENGRRDARNASQPVVPAVFFPCGAPAGSHLDC